MNTANTTATTGIGIKVMMTPCSCGHPRWKHACFSNSCREAGCRCVTFLEVRSEQGRQTKQKP